MTSAVTSRYATALIELAEESKVLDKVEKDIIDLLAMVQGSADLASMIASPVLAMKQQEAAILAVADKAKFQDITKKFLGVLVRNRRLGALVSIIEAAQRGIAARRGEVVADVQTAQAMTAAQAKALQDALSKSMGCNVQLNARVEPGILGGMIVTVGSQMIDDSVARKLERLQGVMSRQANQNMNSGAGATKVKSTTQVKSKKKEA